MRLGAQRVFFPKYSRWILSALSASQLGYNAVLSLVAGPDIQVMQSPPLRTAREPGPPPREPPQRASLAYS
jgi:hypothetical protein